MKLKIGMLLLGSLATACASSPPARVVTLANLKDLPPLEQGQPLIVELNEGDTVPLVFELNGPLLQTDKHAQPLTLRAARHFFLRIDQDGLRSSLDGKSFDDKPAVPGKLQVGFGVSKDGPRANISITTPIPKSLEK